MLFAPPYTISRKAPGLHRQWSTQATTRQPALEPTPSAEALQKLDASLDAFVARRLPPLHQSASAPSLAAAVPAAPVELPSSAPRAMAPSAAAAPVELPSSALRAMHRRNRRFVPPPVKAGEGGGDTLASLLRHDFQAHADGRGAAARAALSREAFGPFEKKRHAPAPSAAEAARQPAHGVPLSLAELTRPPRRYVPPPGLDGRESEMLSHFGLPTANDLVYLHRAATRSRARLDGAR